MDPTSSQQPQWPAEPSATIDGRPVEARFVDGKRFGAVRSYLRDGLLHDPDDGRPARVWYRKDGSVGAVEHWRNGLLRDPDDGSAAVVELDREGNVSAEEHWPGQRR